MPGVEIGDLAKLAEYPFVVISWVDDAGYPLSVATAFQVDEEAGTVSLTTPAGEAVAVPTDREVNLLGSHIRPTPGQGYDERRYLLLWGRAAGPALGRITFTPTQAWGWDEAEIPFFEYAERSVPQSRRYLAQLSQDQGRTVRPRLSLGWLLLRATRLPFLSATLVPVLLGIAVAARHGDFNPWLALVTIIGASFAHLGINVSNDIFDTLSGADEANLNPTQFSGGSRVLIYDLLTLRQLVAIDLGLFGATAAIGLYLVWATASQTLLLIGVAGIALGIAYTAPPLKLVYRGLGEIAVAIGFGPIMLLGAYVVQAGSLSWEAALASVPVAILVALILYVNEIPDRVGDAAAGKRTLPVRLSADVVTGGYLVFALAAFVAVGGGVIGELLPVPTLLALAAIPLVFRVHRGIRQNYTSPYALMTSMATNVNLHLYVGALLVAGYLVTIIIGALS
jgi:1,4-dihydroxy-2-naphthoate octaprenyltransferase